jgi:hypothetical protein
MKFKAYLRESRKTPKDWVAEYMENMFDNGDVNSKEFGKYRYNSWKEFFRAAVGGAYDWSEDLYSAGNSNDPKIHSFRDRIKKVKDSGFSQDKKYFKQKIKERE